MNISDIINFPSFYNFIKGEKMSVKLAYDLTLIKKEVDFHLNFYQSELNKIIEKYAQKDETGAYIKTSDGLGISILPDCQNECKMSIQELLNLEVIYSGPYLNFSDLSALEISPELLEGVLPFVKF